MDWNDVDAIARAWSAGHEDVNYLVLTDDELVALVTALPGFDGPAIPGNRTILAAITSAWIEIENDGEPDDGSMSVYAE